MTCEWLRRFLSAMAEWTQRFENATKAHQGQTVKADLMVAIATATHYIVHTATLGR